MSANTDLQNRRWLVTGAAGFLGSHLVDQLLNRGASVIGLDDLSWGNIKNLDAALQNPQFHLAIADIRQADSIGKILDTFRAEVIVHLAALHYIPAAQADPALTVSINVWGTQVMLSAAMKHGVQRFWFASTGDVYAPSDAPHCEDDKQEPFNIYGLSKAQGEQLIALTSRQNPEARFMIGRLFNLYGPRETNPHIVPEILKQLRERPRGPLHLGNLWPRRELIPTSEAARAIIEMIECAAPGVTTLNLATGVAQSMQQLIEMMGSLLGYPLPIETDPSRVRPVERPHLQADVSRLKKLIGWVPNHDLERGLMELLQGEGFQVAR